MEETKKPTNPFAEAISEAAILDIIFNKNCPHRKPTENRAPATHTEALVDFDHICIPTSQFEELVRAKEQRDILRRAYPTLESYRIMDLLSVVFGPKPKEEKGDAQ